MDRPPIQALLQANLARAAEFVKRKT